MKQICVLILLLVFFGCYQNLKTFSESELLLLKNIGFDKEVLSSLKQNMKNEFTQFEISEPGYIINREGEKQKTGIKKLRGISIKVIEKTSGEIILKNKDKLRESGYLIFLSESGYESPSTISVIKSTDKFDILRIQKTDGINFGIKNSDIIGKLKEWDKAYGITILGADYDWVDIIFKESIENAAIFAKEVYDFCPDSVDQGVGEIDELEKIIREEKRLFLWWD